MRNLIFLSLMFFPPSFVFGEPSPASTADKPVLSSDLNQLDATLLKKRLERAHGELGKSQKSTWEIGFAGQNLKWDWNGAWICPNGKEVVDCNDWKPKSLAWFETKTAWLKPWTSMKKDEFVLDEERKIPTSSPAVGDDDAVEPPSDPVEAGGKSSEPVRLSGQRLALQAWKWSSADQEVKVYTSLRSDWVERIDHDGVVEYIEWKRNPKTKALVLSQLIIEKDGQRLSARRLESPTPPSKPVSPKKN